MTTTGHPIQEARHEAKDALAKASNALQGRRGITKDQALEFAAQAVEAGEKFLDAAKAVQKAVEEREFYEAPLADVAPLQSVKTPEEVKAIADDEAPALHWHERTEATQSAKVGSTYSHEHQRGAIPHGHGPQVFGGLGAAPKS